MDGVLRVAAHPHWHPSGCTVRSDSFCVHLEAPHNVFLAALCRFGPLHEHAPAQGHPSGRAPQTHRGPLPSADIFLPPFPLFGRTSSLSLSPKPCLVVSNLLTLLSLPHCLDYFNSTTIPRCWSPKPTQEYGVLAMMKAPLRPGTRPVGAAQLAVRHVNRRAWIRRHPGGGGPRPQDRRGGVRVRGAPFMPAQ